MFIVANSYKAVHLYCDGIIRDEPESEKPIEILELQPEKNYLVLFSLKKLDIVRKSKPKAQFAAVAEIGNKTE